MHMEMSKQNLRAMMGANLRELRVAHGMSIGELAARIKLTPGFVGLIERGKRGITPHMLYVVAKIFDVPEDDFFKDDTGEYYRNADSPGEDDANLPLFTVTITITREHGKKSICYEVSSATKYVLSTGSHVGPLIDLLENIYR